MEPQAAEQQEITACVLHVGEQLVAEAIALAVAAGSRLAVNVCGGDAEAHAAVKHGHDLIVAVVSAAGQATIAQRLESIIHTSPGCGVILVVEQAANGEWPAAVRQRVKAVCDRGGSLEPLVSAVDRLIGGAGSNGRSAADTVSTVRPLSSREQEVLDLIGRGLTNSEIGDRLGVATHTVRHHRKRIAAKLGTSGEDLPKWSPLARQRS